MAGVEVESVIVNMSGGRLSSQLYAAKIGGARQGGRATTKSIASSRRRRRASAQPGRAVLHAMPTGFWLDAQRGVRDPKGMVGDELGAELSVASCDAAAARNLMLAIERCHLRVAAMVASPYASGLSSLVDDEAELGAALVDFGGGSTTIGVFVGDRLAHVDAVAVGGNHVTMDVARGLSVSLADAERLKTLYGACIASPSDDRETIAVHRAGDDMDHPSHLPKSELVRIIRPRVEEILELVRDRLKAAGHAAHAGRRLVLTGGACQLTGLPELARTIMSQPGPDRPPARRRRPAGIGQEPGLRRGGRPAGLSAGCGARTFRAGTAMASRQSAGRRLCGARGAVAEAEFLTREQGRGRRGARRGNRLRINRRRRAS